MVGHMVGLSAGTFIDRQMKVLGGFGEDGISSFGVRAKSLLALKPFVYILCEIHNA